MDYLDIVIGGTAIMFGASCFLKRYYEKKNSRILDNILNYIDEYAKYTEKEFPTNKENKLEKGAKN